MNQQNRWNEKFSKEGFMYGLQPNAFIKDKLSLIPPKGSVLCLAEGEGRNAIYLAQLGFAVEALDASDVGLHKLMQRAEQESLNIETTLADLENWQPNKQYDAVIASFMHLPEPLRTKSFKKAVEALKVGSYMIMEFFSQDQMRQGFPSGGPKDLSLLYDPQELRNCFDEKEVEIIQLSQEEDILDEGWGHQGAASLVRLILQKR